MVNYPQRKITPGAGWKITLRKMTPPIELSSGDCPLYEQYNGQSIYICIKTVAYTTVLYQNTRSFCRVRTVRSSLG